MVLIYDIETKTQGRPNPRVDEMVFFGYYDTETGKRGYVLSNNKPKIQSIIDKQQTLVNFNGINYDNPIMERAGINLKYKRIIDLYEVVSKRKTLMKLNLKSYSLANLAKHFNLKTKKQEEFDYSILKKDKFEPEDLQYVWEYLQTDLEVTKQLWDYLCDYFSGFKEYLNQKYIDNYSYVSCSGGSLAYKAICSQANLEEEYNDKIEDYERYQGGYVSLPKQETYEENIYLFDFTSLYPHAFMQGNLYSNKCDCCKQEDKWHGNELFNEIKGYYCTQKLGKIESVIRRLFAERLFLKQKLKEETDEQKKKELDRKQLSIKIIMNTMYGISGSPVFKHVYSLETASDCTHIARQCIHYARKQFEDNGYVLIYTDTDSLFVQDPFNNEERVLKTKQKVMNGLKELFPFPQDTFDFDLEAKIKKIFFFKKGNGKFAKKYYMFVKYNNDIVVKGIPVVKSNCSRLSRKIFNEKVIPRLKETMDLNIPVEEVRKWINEELKKDVSIAAFLCRVGHHSSYKNDSQLQAQVSKLYGEGNHWLIPNYLYGAGLCLKYCTVEDYLKKNIHYSQIALDNIFSELEYFCEGYFTNRKISRVQQVKLRKKLKRDCLTQITEWF